MIVEKRWINPKIMYTQMTISGVNRLYAYIDA